MKIDNLLEGTVKAPEYLFNKIMAITCGHVFSQIMTWLNTDEADDYFDNVTTIRRKIAEYKQKFGSFDVTAMKPDHVSRDVVKLKASDVDPRYLKRAPNFKQRNIFVYVSNSKERAFGLYQPKAVGHHPTIYYHCPPYDSIKNVAKSPEYVDAMFDRVEGTIEHELMHAVQQLILDVLHVSGEGHLDANDNIKDYDAYMMDVDEFSPMIVTHAKEITAFLKEMKARGRALSPEQVREFFNSFVNPTVTPPADLEMTTPEFFEVLYRKDRKKWQKAVKLVYDKVRDTMKKPA